MKQYIFVTALAIGLVACGGNGSHEGHEGHGDAAAERKDGFSDTGSTPEDSLYKLVIDGHDEAMAKMGKIRGAQASVEAKIDSLKKRKGQELVQAAYKDVKTKLDAAYAGMNTWMEHFNPDSAKADAAKRLEYLQSELDKVTKVKTAITTGLAAADSVLNK